MTPPVPSILLVEDNEDDVFLLQRALKRAGITNNVFLAEDGKKALAYLAGDAEFRDRTTYPLPALIFLDLKLPMVSGFEVLAWLRSRPEFGSTVVVVLTSSNEPTDSAEAYRLGANSYLVKPATSQQLLDVAKTSARKLRPAKI